MWSKTLRFERGERFYNEDTFDIFCKNIEVWLKDMCHGEGKTEVLYNLTVGCSEFKVLETTFYDKSTYHLFIMTFEQTENYKKFIENETV